MLISSILNVPSLIALLKLNVIVLAAASMPPLPSNLTNQVSIDNKGSDVDLTHWDVTHVSNASRAFFNATSFNQDISTYFGE
jgi:hypothetical protein